MRHRKSINHLGRTASHRKAMLANMAASLIIHKRIKTTTAKAKALRTFIEPLITKSKDDSTHSRRVVFSYLQDKDAVSELFREVSPKVADRPGGYTRILKTGTRLGDNADLCIIELVDYNESLLASKDDAKEKSGRRRRRGGKKKTDTEEVSASAPTEAKVEDAAEPVAEVETVEEVTPEEAEVVAEETTEPVAEVETKQEEVASEAKEEAVEAKEKPDIEEKKE